MLVTFKCRKCASATRDGRSGKSRCRWCGTVYTDAEYAEAVMNAREADVKTQPEPAQPKSEGSAMPREEKMKFLQGLGTSEAYVRLMALIGEIAEAMHDQLLAKARVESSKSATAEFAAGALAKAEGKNEVERKAAGIASLAASVEYNKLQAEANANQMLLVDATILVERAEREYRTLETFLKLRTAQIMFLADPVIGVS